MNLIDKDDLLRDMKKCKAFGELSAKSAIRKVEACPTVDAEPVRHGKWIPWKYHDGFRCEICEEPVYNKHKYCPNCGAKMDVKKNEANVER